MQKNTASQQWVVFGFYESNNVATTGDAGNITAKVSLDHAAPGALTNTHPAEIEDGYYRFTLTQAETNASHLLIMPESNTAGVSVIGVPGVCYTFTPQTGDSYPVVSNGTYGNEALRTAVNTIDDNVDSILADTNTLQTEWADGGRLDLILDGRASQSSLNAAANNIDLILADTNTLQVDWADGGRLDVILDAVATEANVNTVSNNVGLVLADTNTLQADWADGGRLDLLLDAVATETNLNTVGNNVTLILGDTNTLQTEWADGGRLDLLLDTAATGSGSSLTMNTAVPTDGAANTFGHYLRVIDAVVGGKTNAATGTANQVQFLDRDGSTVVRTITYGSADGGRTASTL